MYSKTELTEKHPPHVHRYMQVKSKIWLMKQAIEAFGYHATIDYFGDYSASWIEVRKSADKKEFFSIVFDYAGMNIQNCGLVKGSNKLYLNELLK